MDRESLELWGHRTRRLRFDSWLGVGLEAIYIYRLWGLEGGDQSTNWQPQQHPATDSASVQDHIPEFNSATWGEMLARLHKDSEENHRQASLNP